MYIQSRFVEFVLNPNALLGPEQYQWKQNKENFCLYRIYIQVGKDRQSTT